MVVSLLEQTGGRCVHGTTFGKLPGVRHMWVDGCYGVFSCLGVHIECGFSGMHSPKNCSCDGRCQRHGRLRQADAVASSRLPPAQEGSRVQVVMLETRRLTRRWKERGRKEGSGSIDDIFEKTSWSVAAALNEHYARTHGHSFRFYRAARQPGATGDCALGTTARAAPWCVKMHPTASARLPHSASQRHSPSPPPGVSCLRSDLHSPRMMWLFGSTATLGLPPMQPRAG